MSELKNCPFCGEIPVEELDENLGTHYVRCQNCNCELIHRIWNTRVDEAKTLALIAAVKELLEEDDRISSGGENFGILFSKIDALRKAYEELSE